ncbi:MAG: DUF2721 domain-containing protein [Bdellovibrionaceae bacterium]|nr:DUF2721 domain-containing protein [Pseudobdellovibrionaceae bacterium]NUM58564.1 DUF2721 domain-containing protein [Pseudobdellovibrionaceae bacterium]
MHIDPAITSMSQNPFAIITIIAAPAILTNASSILGLSTGNRLMKCLDTISTLERKIGEKHHEQNIKVFEQQLALSHKQSRHFLRALRSSYVSLGAFAFSCFLALLGSALLLVVTVNIIEPLAVISLFVGGAGVLGLVWSSFELFLASQITVRIMEKNYSLTKFNNDAII